MIKLTKKDRKILYQLELNSRQSLSSIARKVKLSKEVVNYNINKMEKNRLIKSYSLILDLSRLGYSTFRILLNFKDYDDKLIERLKKLPFIGWIVSIEGKWDIVLIIWAKNIFELKAHLEEITSCCNIKDKLIAPIFSIHHLKHNILYEKQDNSMITFGTNQDNIILDELDKKILKILSINARTPLTDIARKCNKSSNVIKYHIKKMTDQRLILGYSVQLDMSLLDYSHFKVLLDLESFNKESLSKLKYYLSNNKNIIYITEAFGLADLEFEALFKTSKELNLFMKKLKKDLPGMINSYDIILTYSEELVRYLPF